MSHATKRSGVVVASDAPTLSSTSRVSKWLHRVTDALGSPWALATACTIVLAWFVVAATAGFSETIQLPINTFTTIVTFIFVFVLQHTQNVNEEALQAKLDEIIRSLPDADDALRGIEKPE